eukprot:NODE_7632_length_583_cov_25.502193_g7609_i0.p1 GENE.NODE_7632_length_583_cov_25.502193_g7609_i0~~NODE_7632_length_583_cov_25.502193_g7609_i0.p1  ORF type:complete len:193 (+),score=23.68 NODE_7632_length_583_cov_25.502193_g7609_i0:63-581(+)
MGRKFIASRRAETLRLLIKTGRVIPLKHSMSYKWNPVRTPFSIKSQQDAYRPFFFRDLIYPVHPLEAVMEAARQTGTGYTAPLVPLTDLPFTVLRTRNGDLPIRHKANKSGTRYYVCVRRVYGNKEALALELEKILDEPCFMKKNNNIWFSEHGVKGKHVDKVRMYLYALGF